MRQRLEFEASGHDVLMSYLDYGLILQLYNWGRLFRVWGLGFRFYGFGVTARETPKLLAI